MDFGVFLILFLGTAIRLSIFQSPKVAVWLSSRKEIVTPLTAWNRVVEGQALRKAGISPYSGDIVHEMPLTLRMAGNFANLLGARVDYFFVVLDIIIALVLERLAKEFCKYLLKKQESEASRYHSTAKDLILTTSSLATCHLQVVAAYMLSPLTIATCVAKSTAVFNNLMLYLAILFMLQDKRLKVCLSIAVASYLSLYPIMLVVPVVVHFCQDDLDNFRQRPKTALLSILSTVVISVLALFALLYVSFLLEDSWEFLRCTYGFILSVPDLTPNIGIFWYFFTEMFEHFRLFFLWVFQINVFIYSLPLAIRLRKQPIFLMFLLMALMSIFKSYPSYADASLYFSLLPLWKHTLSYMRNAFVIIIMIIVCVFLSPILYYLWVYCSSANANFYFAITLALSTAQVFLVTDLLFAFLRREFHLVNGTKLPKVDGKDARIILE